MIRRIVTMAVMIAVLAGFCAAAPPGLEEFDITGLIGTGPGVFERITARAVVSHVAVAAGQEFHLAVDMTVPDGWVYYSPDPGKVVTAGSLKVSAPGLVVGRTLWPKDHVKTADGATNNVYTGRVVAYVPLTAPPDAAGKRFDITVSVQGQICKDACVNVDGVTAAASVTGEGGESEPNPEWSGDSAISAGLAQAVPSERLVTLRPSSRAGGVIDDGTQGWTVWTALGVALLAGLTLNIMPCVLPVIPLRILSIVELAGQKRRKFVTMGLAFAGGMLLFFVGVATANIILKLTVGRAFDLNQHFQEPVVIITLAMIVLAMAANLFGVFSVTVPSKLAGMEGKSSGRGHLRAAGMGVMMGVLATPCSFAYLFSALAWAQSQPLALGTVTILLIGVGMAAPHVLLCAAPGLVNHLPRPGRWMELFRQGSGFVMLLVVVWLLRSLHGQDVSSYPYWVIGWGIVFVMTLWMWASWLRYDASLGKKLLVRGLAVALAVGSGLYMLPAPKPPIIATISFDLAAIERAHSSGRAVAVKFDVDKIADARRRGKVVMVKFTASWCTKCLLQDRSVFNTPEVAAALAARGIVYVKADVGRKDMSAAVWLRDNGYGSAIPLTLVYPPQGQPIVARSFDIPGLIAMLDRAGRK